jgi:hypothetical protein
MPSEASSASASPIPLLPVAHWHHHRTPTQALSHEKLAQGHAKNAVERTHYQVIGWLAQGFPALEVAAVTGHSRSWLYELVWDCNPRRTGSASRLSPAEAV